MKHTLLYVILAAALILSSCTVEKRIANSFVEQSKDAQVAVYFPEKASVTNKLNVALNRYSTVLNGFSQDEFLDVMYNAYAERLRDYNLNVYLPDDPNNVTVDSLHWLVMLSNIEIASQIVEYEDYVFYSSQESFYKHNLNALNVASWFELNNGDWLPVQFVEHSLLDGFTSKADAGWLQSLNYSYSIDTLKLTDVYNYAAYLGKLYAGYTYDSFMNRYISNELKKRDGEPALYLRYDPYRKMYVYLYMDDDDKFIEMEN